MGCFGIGLILFAELAGSFGKWVSTNYFVTHNLSWVEWKSTWTWTKGHLSPHSGDPYFFLYSSPSWVEIRVHTENCLPRLSVSDLKVCVGWVGFGWWVPVNYVVTPTSYWVEVGLWQFAGN